MGVISIRLNKEEEKVLKYLTKYYEEDKSSLLKHSMIEMYEDIQDKKIIKDFEKDESRGKVKFVSADDILTSAQNSLVKNYSLNNIRKKVVTQQVSEKDIEDATCSVRKKTKRKKR